MRKLFGLLLFISPCVVAQPTIADFLSAPFPSELVASRDGQSIAWVFNTKGSRNIFTASSPGFTPQQLTTYTGDDGIDISSLEFTPDAKTLFFVRGNGTNSNGEPANPAQLQESTQRVLWRIDVDGTHLQQISKGGNPSVSPDGKRLVFTTAGQAWTVALTDTAKPRQLFMARGSLGEFRWSPDGKKLAFVSDRDDHSFLGLYSLDSNTITYPDPTVDGESQPVWSPDGSSIAYLSIPNIHNRLPFTPNRAGNPWSIRLYDVVTGKAREIWKAAPGNGSILFTDIPVAENLLWWAINDQLVFPYEKDGWQHLYAINPVKGEARLLTPGEGEIENVVLSNDGRTLFYTTNINDINRRHIWKINMEDGKAMQVTKGPGIEWSPVITNRGIAVLHASATKPAWPAIYNEGALKDIGASLFPEHFPQDLVEPRAVTITASDGIKLTADIFLPPGYDATKKYPAAVFFHGGSRRQMLLGFHYSSYYSNAYALNQYFAANGYIAVSVNYRSGIGYGMEFREALNYGAAGASEVNDVIAVGNYLRGRKDVAPDMIALWGGSYGGFLTAHGLARGSHLFACGVDIHGVHNWNEEIPIFTPWYDYAKFPEVAAKAYKSSPIFYVKGWKSPVLLIHGDDDRNVYFSESVTLAEKLRQQHVHVEQLILPDEVHSFLLYKSWVKVYEATFQFIQRQLSKGK